MSVPRRKDRSRHTCPPEPVPTSWGRGRVQSQSRVHSITSRRFGGLNDSSLLHKHREVAPAFCLPRNVLHVVCDPGPWTLRWYSRRDSATVSSGHRPDPDQVLVELFHSTTAGRSGSRGPTVVHSSSPPVPGHDVVERSRSHGGEGFPTPLGPNRTWTRVDVTPESPSSDLWVESPPHTRTDVTFLSSVFGWKKMWSKWTPVRRLERVTRVPTVHLSLGGGSRHRGGHRGQSEPRSLRPNKELWPTPFIRLYDTGRTGVLEGSADHPCYVGGYPWTPPRDRSS